MAESGSSQPAVKILFGKRVVAGGEAPPTTSEPTTSGDGSSEKKPAGRSTKLFLSKIFGGRQVGGAAPLSRKLSRTAATDPSGESVEGSEHMKSGEGPEPVSPLPNVTLVCRNIPDALNNKNDLRAHFEKFGVVRRVNPLPAQGSATIIFANHSDAVVAKETGTHLRDGNVMNIYFKAARKQSVSGGGGGGGGAAAAAPATVLPSTSSAASAALPRARTVQPLQPLFQAPKMPSRASSAALSWVPPNIRVPPSVASIFSLSGSTAQERAEILEKCDKVIYELMAESANKREHAIVGTCEDMCPERERYDREFQRRVSRFELLQNTEGYIIDHRRALKEYSRSAADQREPLPYELRTPTALDNTMTYLLREICSSADEFDDTALADWADWYHFLWTRTRGIRKDITQQHLISATGISLIERCARFHAFCAERLAEVPSTAGFDQKLNSQNLTKCLQSLKEMYADLRQSKNAQPEDDLPELTNEPEFTGYRILVKLDEGSILSEIERVSEAVRYSRPVQFALAVFSAYNTNNYSRFFRMFRDQATYFEACLMHRYLTLVRSRALKTILHAYTPNERSAIQVPIADVSAMLCFESLEECESFCLAHGIQMAGPGILDFVRMNYYQPETWPAPKRLPSIMKTKQMEITIPELINGGPLDQGDELPEPATSFDSAGLFVGSKGFRAILLDLLEAVQHNHHVQPNDNNATHQEPAKAVHQWPAAQPKVQADSNQVEKTMALHALTNQIFSELVGEVVKSECREVGFSVVLNFKKFLMNAEPICDELLLTFVKDFVSTISSNTLVDTKADVSLRNALTVETTNSVVISIVDSLTKEICRDVHGVLVETARSLIGTLIDDIAREEAKSDASYWCTLASNKRKVEKLSSKRLLRQVFNSWSLQTRQLLSLREHSNRPFPTGPTLTLKEVSETVCCSSKVLRDGVVVKMPFNLSPNSQLLQPEKILSVQLKTATMACSLQLPPEELKIPSLDALIALPGPTNYPVWVLWKLLVVVPIRYRENLYILRNVESIFKSFVPTVSSASRLIASVVLVSVDPKAGVHKVEGSNMLRYHTSSEHDAVIGTSAVLILDDCLTCQSAVNAVGRLLSASKSLDRSKPIPLAVLRLSSSSNNNAIIESFLASRKSGDKKSSDSVEECINFLINSNISSGVVGSAVSGVKFVSEFLYSKVISPIKADLHNRKVFSEQSKEMAASLTLSLYNSALAFLKSSASEVVVAPEIVAALTSPPLDFVALSQEDHGQLLSRELVLPNLSENEDIEGYVKRSFERFPLEVIMLSATKANNDAFKWTQTLLSCMSSRLSLTFSNFFGANSLMFVAKPPCSFLKEFQPPSAWLYEAERVQISAFTKRPRVFSGSTVPSLIKRGISSTWHEIEQLEDDLLAKRLRQKGASTCLPGALLRSSSVSASSLLDNRHKTPLSEVDRQRSMNSTFLF